MQGVYIRLDVLSVRHPIPGSSREGTRWETVLAILVTCRLIDPGSEWRLHRSWFDHTTLADLLGGDSPLAAKDTLCRCHDRLLDHREALFSHLQQRWRDLFNATYGVLLYDLNGAYYVLVRVIWVSGPSDTVMPSELKPRCPSAFWPIAFR